MPKKKKKLQIKQEPVVTIVDRHTSSMTMIQNMASESLSPVPSKRRSLRAAVDQVRLETPTRKDRFLNALQQASSHQKSGYIGERLSKKITDQLTPDDIRNLRMVFDVFDIDKSGCIENSELKKACKILGFNVTKRDINKMMSDVDTDKSGQVDFNEFLEFVVSKQGDERDIYSEIMLGFKLFDRGSKGKITFEDLRHAAKETGVQLSDFDIKSMIYEADKDGDNEINGDEFISIMLKTNLFL